MSWQNAHTQYCNMTGSNSLLMHNNAIFDSMKHDDKIYLFHVTSSMEKIIESKTIYPSSGCLIGSIYATPLKNDSNGFRVHNLGAYYYEKESIIASGKDEVDGIIIEIDNYSNHDINIEGVNYLSLGKIHYDIYNQLSYLLSKSEQETLEKEILTSINKSQELLKLSSDYLNGVHIDDKKFFDVFTKSIEFLPFLGYIYFEAITKTMMLHQTDEKSKKYKEVGEFYNWHYKDMMLHLYPNFFNNFKLGNFNPDFNLILKYLEDNLLIENMDAFMNDFFRRLKRLCSISILESGLDRIRTYESFSQVDKKVYPLLGHSLHRQLRKFNRYPDFYFYFDQMKALDVWNYWNKKNITIPFNGIIPKGEMGINPAHENNFNYKCYKATNYRDINGLKYVSLGKELDISLAKRLVDLRHNTMRDQHNKNSS